MNIEIKNQSVKMFIALILAIMGFPLALGVLFLILLLLSKILGPTPMISKALIPLGMCALAFFCWNKCNGAEKVNAFVKDRATPFSIVAMRIYGLVLVYVFGITMFIFGFLGFLNSLIFHITPIIINR